MMKTVKCNSCVHENICKIKDDFKTIGNKISSIIPENIRDVVSVDISCKHYIPKTVERTGIQC